ncbi:MAG: hypothetical protein WC977_07685 [Anaerovoracaceae bacterium]|jgi:hypothetical protein
MTGLTINPTTQCPPRPIISLTDDALNDALTHYIGDLRGWAPHWQHIEQAQEQAVDSLRGPIEHCMRHIADMIAGRMYEALTDCAQVAPQVLLAALEAERIAEEADHGEAVPAEVVS